MKITKLIEPSLLSIDKKNHTKQLKKIKALKISYVHYDVMDGKFVNNTSFMHEEYLHEIDKLGLKANVHLMVEKPDKWLSKYKKYKLNSLGFHVETQAINQSINLLKKIRAMGFKSMFAIKMETNINKYKALLPYTDIILIMSVEPGWGAQAFNDKALSNLKKAKAFKKQYPNLIIQVDGGVNDKTIKYVRNYADWFITGSWFFKNIQHPQKCLNTLKK